MSTEIQTTQPRSVSAEPKTVKGWLTGDYFRKQVALCLPKHLTPERFCRMALSALTRQPKLAECTPESVMQCMLTLSSLGLEADGRRAHLIPRKNTYKNNMECTMLVDYKGIAELMMRGGTISNIHADTVRENDVFEYDRGELKAHKIDFRRPRGEPYAAYTLLRFKDGSEKCEVMSKEDILAVRDKSDGWRAFKSGQAKQSPWADPQSEPEMWKKTTLRRASKLVVLSPEVQDGVDALEDRDVDMKNVTPGAPEMPGLDFSAPPAIPEVVDEAPAKPITPLASEGTGPATPMRQRAKTPAERLDRTPAPRAPEPLKEYAAATQTEPEPDGDPFAAKEPEAAPEAPPAPALTTVERLADFCTAEGITFAVLRKWAGDQGHIARDVLPDKWEDLSEALAERWLKNRIGLLTQLKLKKKEMGA